MASGNETSNQIEIDGALEFAADLEEMAHFIEKHMQAVEGKLVVINDMMHSSAQEVITGKVLFGIVKELGKKTLQELRTFVSDWDTRVGG